MEESKEKNLETEDCDLAYDCHISVSNKKEKHEEPEEPDTADDNKFLSASDNSFKLSSEAEPADKKLQSCLSKSQSSKAKRSKGNLKKVEYKYTQSNLLPTLNQDDDKRTIERLLRFSNYASIASRFCMGIELLFMCLLSLYHLIGICGAENFKKCSLLCYVFIQMIILSTKIAAALLFIDSYFFLN